jgi:hypothetical protein
MRRHWLWRLLLLGGGVKNGLNHGIDFTVTSAGGCFDPLSSAARAKLLICMPNASKTILIGAQACAEVADIDFPKIWFEASDFSGKGFNCAPQAL